MRLAVMIKVLIKNPIGGYLLPKRTKTYAGETKPRWDIPSGRLIPGETLGQYLTREIKEKTRLIITGESRFFTSSGYFMSS